MQPPLVVYEQKLVEILRTLSPSAAEQVLDFALFIQSKWAEPSYVSGDSDETENEILADEARWDEQFMKSREKLRKFGRKARDNFSAGKTTGMTVINDELAPSETEQ